MCQWDTEDKETVKLLKNNGKHIGSEGDGNNAGDAYVPGGEILPI